jgi:leucyl-tRNA synthetase
MSAYNPAKIEPKWQNYWAENKTFKSEIDLEKPKYYILDMFPYPSGDGLHVGHPEGYTATDILSRWKRMNGFNVLHPMGWDAFGLPAERHAVRSGEHPAGITGRNCDNFKRQIQTLGLSYDWDREISTTDPEYYRWTQWIFLQLFNKGLAYPAEVAVNWCPALGTVLANEEVKDGRYVETGDPVEKRKMRQWMLKITEYAQRLIDDLDDLDWPEGVKTMQREWIGRSEGAEVSFKIADSDLDFAVFTTRPDTLYGATYCVLAPEHPFAEKICSADQQAAVMDYVKQAGAKSDVDRQDTTCEKTGVFTGAYAINPVNGKRMPIWVADYVLGGYGSGAIMAVPGHDQRDWEFATRFELPIVEVVSGGDITNAAYTDNENGVMINSPLIEGLKVPAAKEKITAWLEEQGLGKGTINYKLRDWLFSRQRYWGEPFPLMNTKDGRTIAVREEDLPVTLPVMDNYKPTEDGRPPLARAENWGQVSDPDTGEILMRETNTMPQWAGSCWYYLRFCDPRNKNAAWSKEAENYWMPVDLYLGGAEHAVLHLLYARFWHKVLYDLGFVHTKEPFQKLFNQGMILGESYRNEQGKFFYRKDVRKAGNKWVSVENGEAITAKVEKMSKSRFNVVNPDDMVREFGADSVRLYEMFMGPLDRDKPWAEEGIRGCFNFIKRLWNLVVDSDGKINSKICDTKPGLEDLKILHRTIKSVTQDLQDLKFNTAIARQMEFVNNAYQQNQISKAIIENFILLVSPFMPHIAEELWQLLGNGHTLAFEKWPAWDEELCKLDEITVAVQINGKIRANFKVSAEAADNEVMDLALAQENVKTWIDGKEIKFKRRVSKTVVSLAVK